MLIKLLAFKFVDKVYERVDIELIESVQTSNENNLISLLLKLKEQGRNFLK